MKRFTPLAFLLRLMVLDACVLALFTAWLAYDQAIAKNLILFGTWAEFILALVLFLGASFVTFEIRVSLLPKYILRKRPLIRFWHVLSETVYIVLFVAFGHFWLGGIRMLTNILNDAFWYELFEARLTKTEKSES